MIHLHRSGRIVHNLLAGMKVSALTVFSALGLSVGARQRCALNAHAVSVPARRLARAGPGDVRYSGWNAPPMWPKDS